MPLPSLNFEVFRIFRFPWFSLWSPQVKAVAGLLLVWGITGLHSDVSFLLLMPYSSTGLVFKIKKKKKEQETYITMENIDRNQLKFHI